ATWPTLSVASTRRARGPSLGSGQPAVYGGEVTSATVCQTPVAQSRLVSEHCAKSTDATPVPGSLAVAESVYGSALAALRYAPSAGAPTSTTGTVLSTTRPGTTAEPV